MIPADAVERAVMWCRAGDPRGFDALYDAFVVRIRARLRRHVRSIGYPCDLLLEDLEQGTWLRVWQGLPGVRSRLEPVGVDRWLLRVADNWFRDEVRKRDVRKGRSFDRRQAWGDPLVELEHAGSVVGVVGGAGGVGGDGAVAWVDDWVTLRPAWRSLTDLQKQVVRLAVQGYEDWEIAESVGCDRATVRQRIYAARCRLRQLVGSGEVVP